MEVRCRWRWRCLPCRIQVLAWRGEPSTADRANEVWSSLASTNTTIADLLNALARAAASSSSGDDTGGNAFEDSMEVSCHIVSLKIGKQELSCISMNVLNFISRLPGKKRLKYSRDKTKGIYRSGEGEESLLSGPGSELRLGREKEKEKAQR